MTESDTPLDLVAAIRAAAAVMDEREAILQDRLAVMRERRGPYAVELLEAVSACEEAEEELMRLVRLYGDLATAESARG